MKVSLEIDEDVLKGLVIDYLGGKLNVPLANTDVKIEVKSKQNYRAEWEVASFRARVDKEIS